jgi:AmiR/NasT family two-component response regulator
MPQEGTGDLQGLQDALACTQNVEQFLQQLSERMAAVMAVNEQLTSSIESRALIDQAIGVIMAIRRCTQDEALAFLRSASQNQNVKMREIAAAIVTDVSGEPPGQPRPFERT